MMCGTTAVVVPLVAVLKLVVMVGLVEIMDQLDLHLEVVVKLVVALLEQTLVEVVEEPQDGLLLEMGLVVAVDLE